jgi:DNA-binding XRE family transcriptional regulator
MFSTDSGEELVILSRRDYIALLARAGEEAAEDEMTALIVAERQSALARGEEVALPMEIWDAIEEKKDAVRVLRDYRGITRADLAGNVGISEVELSEIENGIRNPAPDTLKAISSALAVPLSVLTD